MIPCSPVLQVSQLLLPLIVDYFIDTSATKVIDLQDDCNGNFLIDIPQVLLPWLLLLSDQAYDDVVSLQVL